MVIFQYSAAKRRYDSLEAPDLPKKPNNLLLILNR